jgi:hypothetical protein
MYNALRAVYGRLLMIPTIGPMFRIPVLIWRAVFGRQTGLGMSSAPREDALSIAVAAIEGMRDEMLALRSGLRVLEDANSIAVAAIEGMRDEMLALRSGLRALEDANSIAVAPIEGMRDEMLALRSGLRALEDAQVHLAAAARQTEQQLRDRIEFARAETMFELRARLAGGGVPSVPGASGTILVIPRILDAAKVEAMRAAGALRLNVGCGHVPLEGYVNVDMRVLPGVDVVAEAGAIPLDPGTVAEIHSAHLLEHFPVEHLRRVVLPHWHALLRPGGEIRAVVPDAEAMLADFAAGTMSFDDLREVTYGLQEYEGDFHFNMFSRESLAALLREAGFTDARFAFQARKNGKCRDMEIRGVRA